MWQLAVDPDLIAAAALPSGILATLATVRARHRGHAPSTPGRGTASPDDVWECRRQAIEIVDNVVQGLFVAQTALALGERETCEAALQTALAAARQLMSDVLGDADSGVLLRGRPAGGVEAAR